MFKAAQYLCPAIFPWVDRGPATEASGRYVMKMVGFLYILILIFDLIIVCGMGNYFFNTVNGITNIVSNLLLIFELQAIWERLRPYCCLSASLES